MDHLRQDRPHLRRDGSRQIVLEEGGRSLGAGINWFAPDHFASYGNFTLTVTPIPGPGTYALMAAGLMLLAAARLRRLRDSA